MSQTMVWNYVNLVFMRKKSLANDWPIPAIKTEKCTLCLLCVDYCPTRALKIKEGKPHINPKGCSYCGICEDICPASAIELEFTIIPGNYYFSNMEIN
jgi:formate hydrogenlyase subunit 6/NADH:ubiquinone oxidoreductase subunit I